jgi:hypothetical protein
MVCSPSTKILGTKCKPINSGPIISFIKFIHHHMAPAPQKFFASDDERRKWRMKGGSGG